MKIYIYGFLFVLSILPFFCRITNNNDKAPPQELFNPDFVNINSINKAIEYTDSIYNLNRFAKFDTAKYVEIASDFTKNRFYHGISHYSFSENWIAYLSGKILWSHFSAIVKPNDLMKHSAGLCSQQTIVFSTLLKNKHISTRSIGLGYEKGPGHFLCEVKYNGTWHLYDVSKEPQWAANTNNHQSMEFYLSNKDSLYTIYESRLDRTTFNKITEKITYGSINTFPAKKMLLFQQIAYILVYILPLFFLFMFIRFFKN